jgi:hypothetical protein
VHIGIWWGDLRERDHLEDQGVDGNIMLKCNLKKYAYEGWIELM